MFTGIVQGLFLVTQIVDKPGLRSFSIRLSSELVQGIPHGASVAIDGVCLTVTKIENDNVWFDVMEETFRKTTLSLLKEGDQVNVERSAHMGDEIGGHVMSGHISTTAEIIDVNESENNKAMTFAIDPEWISFIFSKGFIGLDGASLTVVDVDRVQGTFQVWFIPETLRLTRFGQKQKRDRVNVEIDAMTQTIVETVKTFLGSQNIYEKNCCRSRRVSQNTSGADAHSRACGCH